MTKAKRLFDRNYRICRKHIEDWGYEENAGYSGIECEDTEGVPTRTCNDIQKLIDKERKHIELDVKLEVIDTEKAEFLTQALNMLQATLNNQRRHNEEFKEMLKSI